MIERLQLGNFQGYESLSLQFGPVTTIVGPTDSGKSSIIRALRWVILNRPRGSNFLRKTNEEKGPKEVKARILADGRQIGRRRTASKNLYLLDGQEYKAFGNDPPQDIVDILRCSEVNFQRQQDPPFWLNLTAGEVAKELNDVADLTAIDEAQARILKEKRRADSRAEVLAEELEEAERAAEALSFVAEFQMDVEKLAGKESKLRAIQADADDLNDDLNSLAKGAKELRQLRGRAEGLQELVGLAQKAGKAGSQQEKLRADLRALEAAEGGLRQESWPELPEAEMKAAKQSEALQAELAQLLGRVKEADEDCKRAGIAVDHFFSIIEQESEGRCPVCGGEFHAERSVACGE